MKHIIKYFFMAVILGAAYFYGTTEIEVGGELVQTAAGSYPDELWQPLVISRANELPVSLKIDDEAVDIENYSLFMDDDLNFMIGLDSIRELFYCAVHEFDSDNIYIEKNDKELIVTLGSQNVIVNDSSRTMDTPLRQIDDNWHISFENISSYLGYSFDWDSESNEIALVCEDGDRFTLPVYYDYREKGRKPVVKNQGSLGTCWAIASLSAMETTVMPGESTEFAADHMSIHNGFNLTQDDGGDYTMAMAYLLSWQGPVLEEDDPYGDGVSPDDLEPVKHVQEIQIPADGDMDAIKEAVYKYGAVQSSIFLAMDNPYSESQYYNRETYAYCYTGDEDSNHDVIIIGWDDEYGRDKFSNEVDQDGAFICQNSWGDDFGDDGVFYISYADAKIGAHNAVYTSVQGVDNFDNIYQSDLLGWIGQIGYNEESAFFANVYTAEGNESIEAVGFYATDVNTEYSVYIVENFEDEDSLNDRELIQSGSFKNAGYYTVNLKEKYKVAEGNTFAVIVEITTPDAIHPVAIEYNADETSRDVDLSDGRGYISYNGESWESTEDEHECNVCLKVYTKVSE